MTIPPVSSRRAAVDVIGVLAFQILATALAGQISLPGCPESCGDVRVPYPFGIGQGCFHDGFNLACDKTLHPPKLFFGGGGGMEVLDISFLDGTVRVSNNVLRWVGFEFDTSWSLPDATGPFRVSSARNSFVAFGCNVVVRLIPHSASGPISEASVCAAMCPETRNGSSCSGVGCCRIAPLAGGALASYGIWVRQILGGITVSPLYGANRTVFIVDQEWFSRRESEMISNFNQFEPQVMSVPMVLEWALDNLTGNKGCPSPNSFPYSVGGDYDGRRCNCSQGYEGNPYLSDGCQGRTSITVLALIRGHFLLTRPICFSKTNFSDIDECQQPDLYPCNGTCVNLPGTYRCSSKKSIRNLRGTY